MDIPTVKLKSGNRMPVLGLGTWNLTGEKCAGAVKKAIELGYTHIDTAEIYGNHKEIGKAIEGSDRSGLFITSKVWTSEMKRVDVHKACDRALKDLGTDYLDLYLIHWPSSSVPFSETLGALNELKEAGKIKSVGISNFTISHMKEAFGSGVGISVNQVEFHPHLYQKELLEFCRKNGTVVTAYSPLGRGRILEDDVLREVAERRGKTAAQVSLKWLLQKGMMIIPKASSEAHMKENMGIFGWELSAKDVKAIDGISARERIVDPFGTFGEKNVKQRLLSFLVNI